MHAYRYSLPKWQAVQLSFFAPCLHNYLSSQVKVGMISEVENAGTFSASLVMQLDFIVICETVHHLSRPLTWVGLISITAYIFKFNRILVLYFTLPVLLRVKYINKQPN